MSISTGRNSDLHISQILEKDGALYFGTRAGKAMHRQLTENNHVALIVYKLRVVKAAIHSSGDQVDVIF